MTTQPPLLDPHPATITVNGAGLLQWAANPLVHIYKMTVEDNGIYKLSLLWLHGRVLNSVTDARFNDPSAPPPERTTPIRGDKQQAEAVKQGIMAFK